MKKNYLLKSSRRRSKYRRPFAIVVIFLLFVMLISFALPKFLPNVAHAIAKPFWYGKEKIVDFTSKPISYFKSKGALQEENERLKERVEALEVQAQLLTILFDENVAIKEILNRDESKDRSLAKVLSRPPQSPFGTIIVDISSETGKKAIAGNSVLLGEVKEVLNDTSIIELYSKSDRVTKVILQESNVEGEARGRGSGNFLLEVPKEAPVSIGEYAVVPELGNYIVGVVEDVTDNEASTFKQVLLRVPLNISSLTWVEIID